MTFRVYLMPITGDGLTFKTAKRGKYTDILTSCSTITYGNEDYCFVGADTTTEQHASIMGNSDVRAFPDNLDGTITQNQLNNISNILETIKMPGQWITVGMTWRTILKRLIGQALIIQGIQGRGFRFLQRGLDETLATLPNNVILALIDTAEKLSLNISNIPNTTTLRQVLTNFGNQQSARAFLLKGRNI